MEDEIERGEERLQPSRVHHIKKRTLKNKALSISFNEKDLKDYVTGFHKRKKKRRKEAQKQQEEALRRKRIELRKKRKLEKELAICGGAAPGRASDESDENNEDNKEGEPAQSINGTTMYENEDLKITVTTSEISREDMDGLSEKRQVAEPMSPVADKKHGFPVTTHKFMKASKSKSRRKPQNKRLSKNSKEGSCHLVS